MADRVKGITVEIGGDDRPFKALSGVNKEIKNTQSQLKDVNKLLKLDPTNTTCLNRSETSETGCLETKDKLTQLKSVQDQMDAGLKTVPSPSSNTMHGGVRS